MLQFQTIPLNPKTAIFTQLDKKTIQLLDFSSECYITFDYLTTKLNNIPLPINDRGKAIKRILEFLIWLDNEIKEKDSTLFTINKDIFVTFFTSQLYTEYQTILQDLKILTNVQHAYGSRYKHAEWNKGDGKSVCKNYRIHNKYMSATGLVLVIFATAGKKQQVTFKNEAKGVHPKMIAAIKNIQILVGNAVNAELAEYRAQKININQLKYRISRIFSIRKTRKITSGHKVKRVYHSLTNLSKVSRKNLNYKFFCIDVVNCQPCLLVAYLTENKLGVDDNYTSDCENGCIYERFIHVIDPTYVFMVNNENHTEARDKTKKRIYKDVFFGFNKTSLINKVFKKLYPLTWQSLNDIKQSDKSLASILQNTEASLFNFLVPKKSKYFFTLFDAIYFTNGYDTFDLEQKIKKFFLDRGVKVQLK